MDEQNDDKPARSIETAEKEVKELQELLQQKEVEIDQLKSKVGKEEQEIKKIPVNRPRAEYLITGAFSLMIATVATITIIGGTTLCRDMGRSPLIPQRTYSNEESKRSGNIPLDEDFIDTLDELRQFLEIPSGNREDEKAHLTAFQEKCYYLLGMELEITGNSDVRTYLAANRVKDSPHLQKKLSLEGSKYAYMNRNISGFNVKIPHIALAKIKERLENHRDLETVLGVSDPTIARIARELTHSQRRAVDKAYKIYRFVQGLQYNYDIDEYTKHPLETIADGGGDCEDTSALYALLAKAAGLDAGVALFPEHAMAAVDINSKGKWYMDQEGKKYTLIETTGRRELGEIDTKFQKQGANLILIK